MLVSSRQRKSNERQQHALAALRGVMEKDTWKTPTAAPSRRQAGRRRQSVGRENPPGVQGVSVGALPATSPILRARARPASPVRLCALRKTKLAPPSGKRKRRRRSNAERGVQKIPGQQPSQNQPQAESQAAGDGRQPAGSGAAKSGRNRRKHRGKRGLQGRPLAHEKTVQLPAAAGRPSSERPVAAPVDQRSAERQQGASVATARSGTIARLLRRKTTLPALGPRAHLSARPLCGARSRHQQLPPAGRAADTARPVPRRRCLFAHRSPRRGARRQRQAFGRRDGSRRRGAARLRGKLKSREDQAHAPDCDGGLPGRRKRRSLSGPGDARRRDSSSRSSIARPRHGLPCPAARRWSVRKRARVVLFDIGGGSSEIAVIRIGGNRSSRLANHITHWTSLPVGVVTLSERHGGRDVTP